MPIFTLAVATLTLAQALDLGTFVAMVRQGGIETEANPFVAQILAGREGRVERAAGVLVIAVAIVAGIVGGGTNVMTMGGIALAR